MNIRVEIYRKIIHVSSSLIAFGVLVLDREVYIPMGEDGRWRVIMYGNNNEVFFEKGLDVYGDPVPYDEHVNIDGLNNERPEMFGNIVKKDEWEDE